MRRADIENPYLSFHIWNDYHWLDMLERPHNTNRNIKIALALNALALSVTGTANYFYQNDYAFRSTINENWPTLMSFFQMLGGN